jgi:hypothetical protein
VQPAFEDTWYYLWRERRLPVNVDPFDARLDDELERARLRRVFSQGLDATVGYLLPLRASGRAAPPARRWITGPWFLRDERLYLMPGDSPMGYRLPLDSLPWAAAGDRQMVVEQDPFSPSHPLPSGGAAPAAGGYDAHRVGGGFAEGGRWRCRDGPSRTATGRRRTLHGGGPGAGGADRMGRRRPHHAAPAGRPAPAHPAGTVPARRIRRLADAHRAVRGSARPAARQRPQGRTRCRTAARAA